MPVEGYLQSVEYAEGMTLRLLMEIFLWSFGSAAVFVLLCICLRSVVKLNAITLLLLPAVLFCIQIGIFYMHGDDQESLIPHPQRFWVKGLAYRASLKIDFQRASAWAQRCVDRYEEGSLPTDAGEISPEHVPDFIVAPWPERPTVHILNPGVYVDETCVCLSWYGYHFVFSEPTDGIRSAFPTIVEETPFNTCVIYDRSH